MTKQTAYGLSDTELAARAKAGELDAFEPSSGRKTVSTGTD